MKEKYKMRLLQNPLESSLRARSAKPALPAGRQSPTGLLRRCAPRNDFFNDLIYNFSAQFRVQFRVVPRLLQINFSKTIITKLVKINKI